MRLRSLAENSLGINIIGYVTGNLGLGVATRNTIKMLMEHEVPIALTDVDPGSERSGHDKTYLPLDPVADNPIPHPITIFHMNPPGLADLLWLNKGWTKEDRLTAEVPFWELPTLPESWLPLLDAMDIILAPTRFIEETVHRSLPDSICLYYRQAAFVPSGIIADKARWGVPEGAFTLVSSFDISSDIERKNPQATIDAFRMAFPDDENVRLILKVNSSAEARMLFADRLNALLAAAENNPRLIIIDRVLDYRDVLSLYASSDVLVSLHRSEGLGLSLMEAMSFGKPVITTGWSGNMDFCTEENSCLVGYDFIPVVSQHPSYSAELIGEGAYWADPRVSEAAEHMRRLAGDPELVARLGEQARRDMEATRRAYESGEILEELRAAIRPGSPVWQRHASKRAKLRRIARGSLRRNIRRLGGRVLRRLGLRK